ncbi:hypothetical protein MTR_1g054485 [Medicago truncatula]|uniref:Uncharacterized protein n=1 Tax=Medicago truncatula TaxID=3880 RepID=A0A072VIV5_MEDTR|nr:hypothetical protein MTR_1g054485 [Medicago truncatula]
MEGFKTLLQKDPTHYFSVVKIAEQMHPEVEPSFVNDNLANLACSWHLLNNENRGHILTFNKSLVNPLLTHGWSEFKDFNDLPDNVEIVFGYYGYNMFSVYMFKTIYKHTDLPAWHSRCIIANETAFFDSLLTEEDFHNPMKQVDCEFAQYLKQYGYQGVKLCADNGYEGKFQVYFLNDEKLTTHFGTT